MALLLRFSLSVSHIAIYSLRRDALRQLSFVHFSDFTHSADFELLMIDRNSALDVHSVRGIYELIFTASFALSRSFSLLLLCSYCYFIRIIIQINRYAENINIYIYLHLGDNPCSLSLSPRTDG